jgi:hypothetical protein
LPTLERAASWAVLALFTVFSTVGCATGPEIRGLVSWIDGVVVGPLGGAYVSLDASGSADDEAQAEYCPPAEPRYEVDVVTNPLGIFVIAAMYCTTTFQELPLRPDMEFSVQVTKGGYAPVETSVTTGPGRVRLLLALERLPARPTNTRGPNVMAD